MSDFERETYLRETRAEAWDAFMKAYSSTGDAGQIFAAAAEVYERELRGRLDVDEASDRDYAADLRSLTQARTNVQQMIDKAEFGTPEHFGLQMILADLEAVLGPDLVREVDPTGTVLTALPYEQRKRMLNALPDGPLDPEHERAAREMLGLGRTPGVFVVTEEEAHQALEVGSPEHDAFCREQTEKMAADDVARGEGEEADLTPGCCSKCQAVPFVHDGIVQRHRNPATGLRCDGAGERVQ